MLHFSLLHSKTFRGFSSAQQTGSSLAPVSSPGQPFVNGIGIQAQVGFTIHCSLHLVLSLDLISGSCSAGTVQPGNPLFEGHSLPSTLAPALWLTNQQHHHRMLMAILLNWPPLPPFKQICAVLSTAQSHWPGHRYAGASELKAVARVAASIASRGGRLQPTPDFFTWRHDEAARSSSPLSCTHNTREARRSSRESRLSVS